MESLDRVTELSILYEISGLPTRLKNVQEIARLAVDKIVRLLGCDVAMFYLYQEDTETLCIESARGIRLRGLSDLPLDTLDAALAQVFSKQRALAWSLAESPDLPNLLGARYPVQAAVAVPVHIEQRMYGFIYAVRLKPHPFGAADLSLFAVLADRVATAIADSYSFMALERRVNELQILNQVGEGLSKSLDLSSLLANLHQQVNAILDADSFFVILSDADAEAWFSIYYVERGEVRPMTRSVIGAGLSGYILKTGKPLLLRTETENSDFLQTQGVELVGEQAKSWLGVPLIASDEVIGVMALQSYDKEYCYDAQDMALLSTLSSQAAIAINNARLFKNVETVRQDLQERSERLKVLQKVTLDLAEEQRDLDTLLDVLMDRATLVLDCDGGSLWLLDSNANVLELVAQTQVEGFKSLVGRRLLPGEGMVGIAFSERRSVTIEDYPAWAGRVDSVVNTLPFRSALCVPVVWRDEVFGVLNFTRLVKKLFSEDEQNLAELLSGQAAAVIQNARLFSEMQVALNRTEALYKAGRALIAFDDLQEAMNTVAEGVAVSLPANRVTINIVDMEAREISFGAYGGLGALSSPSPESMLFDDLLLGLSDIALRDLKPVLSPKWMIPDPREPAAMQRLRADSGIGSMVVVPIQYRGDILGTMVVSNLLESADFTEADVDLISAIANQTSAAVANSRLLGQMRDTLLQSEQRALKLRAATEVAETLSSVLDLSLLLPQVVRVIHDRFELYYVGLFLVDDTERWAVLRAGTGHAGKAMLASGHRLSIGGESMIGNCIAQGQARIALDVGEEATRFNNPVLPDTRSEMAMPLLSRGRVIGAMTIQSDRAAAFSPEDITTLQTMANQVAVAIENARLFADAQAALEEMSAIQRRYLGQAWSDFISSESFSGYLRTPEGITALGSQMLPEVQQVLANGETLTKKPDAQSDSASSLVVPIKFRDQPIGAFGFAEPGRERQWTDDDIALAEAVAEQLALAAENLRLLDETQRRASREQLIGHVTASVRESLEMDQVLRTAVQELRRALNATGVEIHLREDASLTK